MDGIILIDKEKGFTSRDIVNMVSKKLNIKKVGHTGTLDPIATGLIILCVNEGCKLVELLTGHDKEYIAKVKIGIKTDTFDITGKILEKKENLKIEKNKLVNVLNSFSPKYLQEVPIYSAVKVNGKKLYEYAREGKEVLLPKHLVEIKDIKLLELKDNYFVFKVKVSSGTYIRSLINDISNKLNIPLAMEELRRISIGNYRIEDAGSINNIKILPITSINLDKIEVDDFLYNKVSNGVKIKNIYQFEKVLFTYKNTPVAIYQRDNDLMKPYRVFKKQK